MVALLRSLPAILFAAGVAGGGAAASARAAPVPVDYARPGPHRVTVVDEVWFDAARARSIPVRIYLPADVTTPAPVVVFSHGLGNSREGYGYLGRQWASHGFVSVHPEHTGAAHDVERKGLIALYRAGKDTSYWKTFAEDIVFVLDALPRSSIAARADASRAVLAGHSLGAYAVLAAAGLHVGDASYRDARVVAGIPISMSERFPPAAYRDITIPLLHMTGTHDSSLVYGTLPRERRVPWESIGAPGQYLLTIAGANHSTFSDEDSPANQRAHELIRAVTTAFLDAMLRNDSTAIAWLRDGGLAGFAGRDARLEVK